MSVIWKRGLTFIKDPDSVLDYPVNFSDWLGVDTIDSHTVTAESGLTKDSSSNDSTTVTAWVSGGTVGNTYDLTYHIVTTAGREIDRTIKIKVRSR